MFCIKCGARVDDDAVFCDKCGQRLDIGKIEEPKIVQPRSTSANQTSSPKRNEHFNRTTTRRRKKMLKRYGMLAGIITAGLIVLALLITVIVLIVKRVSNGDNAGAKNWPDGLYELEGGDGGQVEAFEFADPNVVYYILKSGGEEKYEYKFIKDQMLVKEYGSSKEWEPEDFEYDKDSKTLIYTDYYADSNYYKYSGKGNDRSNEDKVLETSEKGKDYTEDGELKHFEIDDRLKNSSLADGYVQFGDMVFQGGAHMTMQDVKDIIDASSLNVSYEEYWLDEETVAIQLKEISENRPFEFKWIKSDEEHNFGELDTLYLVGVQLGAPCTKTDIITTGIDTDSIYFGPFQYKLNKNTPTPGLFDGSPLNRERLLEYLAMVSAIDGETLPTNGEKMFGIYPIRYNNNGKQSTIINTCDSSFANLTRYDKPSGDTEYMLFQYEYSFNWDMDGSLLFNYTFPVADYVAERNIKDPSMLEGIQ